MSKPGRLWMKFYPRDWRGDQALRSVSIAARGLWIEMLFIMHEATPYGHLLLGKRPIDLTTLASMTGVPLDLTEQLFAELKRANVFTINKRGVVISRRMVDDAKRSDLGRKAVKVRYESPENPSRIDSAQSPEIATQSQDRTTQRAEGREQIESTDVDSSAAAQAKSRQKTIRKPTGTKAVRNALMTTLSAEAADAIIEHRLQIKYPLGVRAAELLAKHYAQANMICGLTPDEAADYQIDHGWRGFDPEWVRNAQQREPTRRTNQATGPPDDGSAFRDLLRRKAQGE